MNTHACNGRIKRVTGYAGSGEGTAGRIACQGNRRVVDIIQRVKPGYADRRCVMNRSRLNILTGAS